MDDQRVPIEVVLPGATVLPWGEGEIGVEAFVLIKVKEADGSQSWSCRT